MKKLTKKDIKILGEGPQIKKAIKEQYDDLEVFFKKFPMPVQPNTFISYLSRDVIESGGFKYAVTKALDVDYNDIVIPIKNQIKNFVNDIYDNIKIYRDEEDQYMMEVLLKKCKQEDMNIEAGMMYRTLGKNYYYQNKINHAVEYYELAIEELPEYEVNKQVFFYCELADCYFRENMIQRAEKKYKFVEELIQKYKNRLDNNTMYYYNYWRGIMYLYDGRYRVAREHFQKAVEVATQNFEKAGAISNIGLSYSKIRRYKEALKYFNEALTYPDESNMSPTVVTYNNMAEMYRKMGDCENALMYINLAMDANANQNNLINHLLCVQTYAEIQMKLGKLNSYKEYFEALLSIKGKQLNKSVVIFNIKIFISNTSYNVACLKGLTRVILELTKTSDSEGYINGLYECLGHIYAKLIEYGGIKYEKPTF